MHVQAARAQGTSPSQAPGESVTPAFRSGAVVIFVQGGIPDAESAEAEAEVETLLRSGSTTVFITGVVKPALLKVDCSDNDPVPLFGRGILQLSGIPDDNDQEGALPFVMTASGVLEDGTLPIPLGEVNLERLSIPVDLVTAEGLPYSMMNSEGRIAFSVVSSECGSNKVLLNMTATGTVAPLKGCKWPSASNKASRNEYAEESPVKLMSGATIVFLETQDSATENPDEEGITLRSGSNTVLRSGSNTVLRSGSNTVFLTGGVRPSLFRADGTLPFPFTGMGVIDINVPDDVQTVEGVFSGGGTPPPALLSFTLKGDGKFAVPKDWLEDGTLPLPRLKELSGLAIDLDVETGLTLPKGLKGTGKLVIPDFEDGPNPWPSIPKDMLPLVLTGSGTFKLEDGTWPRPRLEMEDRTIRTQRLDVQRTFSDTSDTFHVAPEDREVTRNLAQPGDLAPVIAPEDSEVTLNPAEPGGLAPVVAPEDSEVTRNPTQPGGLAPVIAPEDTEVTREPVHPDNRAPVIAPEDSKATPDPVNPDNLPPSGSGLVGGPSGAGPDPTPTEDRKVKGGCCCGH